MFLLSTGDTRESSKEIGKLGVLEREICRSWVFKELNFTRLRRSHQEILSTSSRIEIGKIKTRSSSRSKRRSRIEMS